MRKFIPVLLLGFTLLAAAVEVEAGRQVAEGNTQADEAQIKDRAKLFYQDLLKNDRIAALELVATDSKNQFLNNRYAGLMDFRVVGVAVEPTGDKATVRVIRVTLVPRVSQPFDFEVIDTWQRSNGQWYLVLPPPGELNTPFGKIKLDKDNSKDNPDLDALKQKIQQHYKNVDPEQYVRALQKVIVNSDASGAKPPDKQPAQPSPSTQDDNHKPQT